MEYKLLVDLEVVAVLNALPAQSRKRLLKHFAGIRATPDRLSDCHESDRLGRRVEISIFAGYAIQTGSIFPIAT